MNEQVAPGHTQKKKHAYRVKEQGYAVWEEYKDIV